MKRLRRNSNKEKILQLVNATLGPNDCRFNLFSYGSNSLEQLGNRLGVSSTKLKKRAWGATCTGMVRGFFGYSSNWGGSVATLVQEIGGQVHGIIIQITKKDNKFFVGENADIQIDFLTLCENECLHIGKYFLQRIYGMSRKKRTGSKEWTECSDPTFAFIGNLHYEGNPTNKVGPSKEYISAIQKMLLDRRELLGNPRNEQDPPEIDIRII